MDPFRSARHSKAVAPPAIPIPAPGRASTSPKTETGAAPGEIRHRLMAGADRKSDGGNEASHLREYRPPLANPRQSAQCHAFGAMSAFQPPTPVNGANTNRSLYGP